MAKKVRVKMNHAMARALLQSSEVQADLMARAGRVQDAVNARLGAVSDSDLYRADVVVGKNRARAIVGTAGFRSMRDNARNNSLLKALDRGR